MKSLRGIYPKEGEETLRRLRVRTEIRKDMGKAGRRPVGVRNHRVAVAVTAVSIGMAFPAYADGLTVTDAAIKTMLNSTIDVVFLIFSVGIAVMGAFQLIPAIIHFIQASNSQNGEQRKEAGSGIGTSIMILLLAGLVFMLKMPLKGLVGLGG